MGNKTYRERIKGGLLFSYLFIENYRTIDKKSFSFDHRYDYNPVQKLINEDKSEDISGPYFYSKNVYSMSCIVGRNGEGKTSLTEFLSESFILIMYDVDNEKLKPDGNHISTYANCEKYHLNSSIHLSMEGNETNGSEAKFLIIFSVDGEDYYLTNIEGIRISDSISERLNFYPDKNLKAFFDKDTQEKIKPSGKIKIITLSQMRYPFEVAGTEKMMGRPESVSDILSGFGKKYLGTDPILSALSINMTEEYADIYRQRLDSKNNYDIIYQLTFLKLGREIVENLFPNKIDSGSETKKKPNVFVNNRRFYSVSFDEKEKTYESIESDVDTGNISSLNDIFNEPQSFIRPFSSGEYNRFALFSRLYWVLKGRRVFEKSDIGSALDPNDIESLVSTGSTEPDSLILIIDEGDLCYHPEWQRCFVSNILHVIDECSNDSFSEPGCRRAIPQIQIVFTTNSPFMLSDMLREDIFTLSHDRELKKEYMTFGQNIHMLLAHQFFMKKTIGQAAEEEICWLIRLLANESNKKEKDTTFEQEVGEKYRAYFEAKGKSIPIDAETANEFIENLICNIGEDVYRRQLHSMFRRYRQLPGTDESKAIKYLKRINHHDPNPEIEMVIKHLETRIEEKNDGSD